MAIRVPKEVFEAKNVSVTANNNANDSVYPVFVEGATGIQGIESDTGFHYNPSSGTLTSTIFVGALTGNASGSSGSCTGNAATATALATARTIGCTAFDGTDNINLPGVNAVGNQNTAGNAATATLATTATNVTVSANNSSNETVYPVFVDGATGTQGIFKVL